MLHRSGFTQKTLIETFKHFGFESVAVARREEYRFRLASKKKLLEDELVGLAKQHFP